MIIRVLAVEDELDAIDELTSLFEDVDRSLSVRFAESRSSAIAALSEEFFDFVTLDLKLPINDRELDVDPLNGMEVLNHIIQFQPGTPVVVLTGSPAEDHFDSILTQSTKVDIWANGTDFSTIRFFKKNKLAEMADYLRSMVAAIRGLDDIEQRGDRLNLPANDERLIRILVRQREGVSYTIQPIGGGLSGADVYRLTMTNAAGAPVGNVIIKVGDREMVNTEERNYGLYANRLQGAATPRFLSALRFGAGHRAAIAYTLAEGFDRNAFDVATGGDEEVSAVLQRLLDYLRPWREGVPEQRVRIADVRRGAISDPKLAEVVAAFGLDWVDALEQRPVQVRSCSTHGDFHGGNVLVDREDQPTFIDYGDIGERPVSFDWVTLELSLLFHTDGPAKKTEWPTVEQCHAWGDVDAYVENSPFASFVRFCRRNAIECGAGEREVVAAALAYLLRQLRYGDTDKERALALLEGVRRLF